MITSKENSDFIKNMEELDKVLSGLHQKDVRSACDTYAKIKPILEKVLPLLGNIPVIGKIASVVQLLMPLADSACKVS